MALLSTAIQRSTRALQPAATAVATGTLYYVTDEGVIERSNGTTWDNYSSLQLAASTLAGRGSAGGTGAVQSITLGAGLAMSGTTLSVSGGGSYSLLGQNSGSDTTAAATNVYTLAVSGLTALDRLRVILSMSSTSNSTAQPLLQQSTDSVSIIPVYLAQGAVGSGRFSMEEIIIGPQPNTLTGITAFTNGWSSNLSFTQGWGQSSSWTQNWTGSWNLSLRTGVGGVTAGGTFRWNIAVYKSLGQ